MSLKEYVIEYATKAFFVAQNMKMSKSVED